jgi:hypothetical protein
MTEVRKDIFPRMAPLFKTKEATLSEYASDAFEAMSSIFQTKEQITEYINSLDSPETAELFLKICRFYIISKKYQEASYIKLIMMISAIERLISKDRAYVEFYEWIMKQDKKIEVELAKEAIQNKEDFKKIVKGLTEQYFEIFSSRRNIIDFFQNHLSANDQIKLIRSFRGYWVDVIHAFSRKFYEPILLPFPTTIKDAGKRLHKPIEKSLMPYCYDWQRCWVEYGNCASEIDCALALNDSMREKFLRRVVTDLYQIRNDFVHSARITPLNDKDSIGTLSVLGADRKPVSIELTVEDLESLFERGLKHYLDNFVKPS